MGFVKVFRDRYPKIALVALVLFMQVVTIAVIIAILGLPALLDKILVKP